MRLQGILSITLS
jgi:DNA mismatch endonuclease, patch repair protein